MRLISFALAAFVLSLLAAATGAQGALLLPGGSATIPSHTDGGVLVPATGDLLASDARLIPVHFAAPAGFEIVGDFGPDFLLSFNSEVRRNTTTGKLSFLYSLLTAQPGLVGDEGALATYDSLAGFTTDVSAEGYELGVTFTRSADGATITADGGRMGLGFPPVIAVATDAVAFDTSGAMTVQLSDEFAVREIASGLDTVKLLTTTAAIPATFQPAVPEPAWGLVLLCWPLSALRRPARREKTGSGKGRGR